MWERRRCRLKSGKFHLGGGQFCPQPAFSRLGRAQLACAAKSGSAAGRVPAPRGINPAPHGLPHGPKQVLIAACLLACGAFLIRAELQPWQQHTAAGPVIAALFRSVSMPGGSVPILLPPAEARPALTTLISGAPRDAMLYRLRAQEAEVALDFTAAEADWTTYAHTAADPYGAQIELADFYHRRIRPRDELAVLTAAAAVKDDPPIPATAQRAWRAFERMASAIEREALPESVSEPVFRAWVARYPKESAAW